jgi:hypothetical protein
MVHLIGSLIDDCQLPAHSMDTVNKMKFCWVLYWLLGGYGRLRASSFLRIIK